VPESAAILEGKTTRMFLPASPPSCAAPQWPCQTRAVSLGICGICPPMQPGLGLGASACDRERPIDTGDNGPLMACQGVRDLCRLHAPPVAPLSACAADSRQERLAPLTVLTSPVIHLVHNSSMSNKIT
jgi:hypothetical protein